MKWIASNGDFQLRSGVPVMISTATSSLQLTFDDGLDFLDYVNKFVIPVAEKYGYHVVIDKDKSKASHFTHPSSTLK